MAAPAFDKKRSRSALRKFVPRGRANTADSENSLPADVVADAALEKSQRLIDEMLALGLDIDDGYDTGETGSTCTGGSARCSSFLSDDFESDMCPGAVEPVFREALRDTEADASTRIGDHVDMITRLLLLQRQIHELREQKKSLDSIEVQSHLDTLQARLCLVKKVTVKASSVNVPLAKASCMSGRPSSPRGPLCVSGRASSPQGPILPTQRFSSIEFSPRACSQSPTRRQSLRFLSEIPPGIPPLCGSLPSMLRPSSSEASLVPHGVTTLPAQVVKRSASGAQLLRAPSPSSVLLRQVRAISPPHAQSAGWATPGQAVPPQAASLPRAISSPRASSLTMSVPAISAPRLSVGGSSPRTSCVVAVSGASATPAPIVKPPPSSFSVRILEVSSGRTMSSAMVYLYHPPFALEAAVEYTPNGDGPAVELFKPPRGWGVLRSSAGLLLWLSLSAGSLLEEKSISDHADSGSDAEGLMRFDFEAAGGSAASVEAFSLGRAEGHMPLLLDEGLLHPHDGRSLHVQLSDNFDLVVKEWLGNNRACARTAQIKGAISAVKSPGSSMSAPAVVDRLQRSDAKGANVTNAAKVATILRSFT